MKAARVDSYDALPPVPARWPAFGAGALAAVLDGPDVRRLRVGATLLLNRVHLTVRGPDWSTAVQHVEALDVRESDGAVELLATVRHADDENDVRWEVRIVAAAQNRITWEAIGTALRDQRWRRAGWNVLLPDALAGRPYRAQTPRGRLVAAFPFDVLPQILDGDDDHSPMPQFMQLELDHAPGVRSVQRVDGATFELEDQRNWGDASFKAYPGSALDPARDVARGTRVEQRIVLEVGGGRAAPRRPVARHEPAVQAAVDPLAASLDVPALGISIAAEHPTDPTGTPGHLHAILRDRVDIDRFTQVDARLRPTLIVCPKVVAHVDALAGRVETLALRTERGTVPEAAVLAAARERFPGPLVAEADAFVNLNGQRPDLALVDGLAWSFHPQTHATDAASILETPRVLGRMARTARLFAADRSLTVRLHLAPPGAVDRRVELGCAWAVASAVHLVAAGVWTITFDGLDAAAALLHEALAGATRLSELAVTPAGACVGLAIEHPDGTRALAASLAADPLVVNLQGRKVRLAPFEVAVRQFG